MPFFVTRRKLSRRRLKLPRQPGRGARARFRNFGAGSLPVAFRNNFPGDGRSFRDSRGKPAPSLARALAFWRWGLARRASRNNFPGDGQSFCDSLPRARFRRFGAGGWPDGLPETSFRATRSGGILDGQWPQWPFYQPEADKWPVADFILSRIRRLSAVKPSHFYQGLAELQLYQGRFVKPRRGALLALASVILLLGAGPLLPETTFRATAEASATAMANPRRRSRVLRCSGAGGWSVGLPETIFRATAKASATASLALASVVLALGGGRTGFPKQVSEQCEAEGSWTASGRNGRFINQKRTSGQISQFGLRMAKFILSRKRSLSAAKPSHFYQGLAEWQLYQRPASRSGRLSKPMAVVSRPASLWPFYQEWPLYQD